jgi:molecular chaperone IbpA
MRTAYDFSPLFRTGVGFDRLSHMLNTPAPKPENDLSYPAYNIEQKDNDHYRVTLAVAGFKANDVDVILHENTLMLSGRAEEQGEKESLNILHHGIARRAFKRRFQLADHIKVEDAGLEDGLLTINLAREVPEEKRPHKIEISGSQRSQNKAA